MENIRKYSDGEASPVLQYISISNQIIDILNNVILALVTEILGELDYTESEEMRKALDDIKSIDMRLYSLLEGQHVSGLGQQIQTKSKIGLEIIRIYHLFLCGKSQDAFNAISEDNGLLDEIKYNTYLLGEDLTSKLDEKVYLLGKVMFRQIDNE